MKIPRLRWLFAATLSLVTFGAALSARAQASADGVPVPSDMQLFLLVGQSNMAGRGPVEPIDEVTHPRIFVFNKEFQWMPAKDPLHFDRPEKKPGVGLASQFARVLAEKEPGVTIGLIPCAVGGTALAEWASPESALFKNAVDRARKAQAKGKIVGILWHQGETGCSSAQTRADYPDSFAEMIGRLRSEIGAENAPLIIGELGRWKPGFIAFNREVIPAVAQKVPNCAFVTSEDLKHKGDNLHFDSASLRILGARYAEALLKLQAK